MTDRRVKKYLISDTDKPNIYKLVKKEQKMTREEAIERLKNIKSVPSMFIDETIKELVEALQEPPTLADFLGWEEGQEYEAENGTIYNIQNDIVNIKFGDPYYFKKSLINQWFDELRQAKKVEPKLKAYHVKDEYSFNSLIEELNKQGYRWYGASVEYEERRDVVYCENYFKLMVSSIEYFNSNEADNYDLIEYHKEEPKYKWRFKSVKTIRIDGKVLYFHHAEDCDLILDSYPNVRYMTEKLLREELRGTRFNVADFERVE